MQYRLTITSADGSEVIELGKTSEDNSRNQESNVISGVDIVMDTIDDDVLQKSNAVLAKITVYGNIKEEITEELRKIFEWSCEYDSDKWYRTVEIEIKKDNKSVIRTYIFKEVFLVDYKEQYKTDGTNQIGKFVLSMTQRENNLDKIDTF